MGMFSSNRTYLGSDIDVVANESYVGIEGAYRAMCEGYQNSYAIFESCIGLDFMEAAVVNEGYSENEFSVIQENFVMDFFTKLKEFLVKLLEKIKGIISSFITKVVGTFTKDGKELVNKYKKQIMSKDLSKMKYKYAKPTGKEIQPQNLTNHYNNQIITFLKKVNFLIDEIDLYTNGNGSFVTGQEHIDDITKALDDNDYLEEALAKTLSGYSGKKLEMSEYAKEAKEHLFEDEEKETEDAGKLISELILTLTTAEKQQKELKRSEREDQKTIKDLITKYDRASKEANNKIPATGAKAKNVTDSVGKINKVLNLASRAQTQMSSGLTKAYAVKLELIKFHFAQCKRIWVQMAAYNPKTVKEDAELLQAIGEAAEYEAYSSFTEAEMY